MKEPKYFKTSVIASPIDQQYIRKTIKQKKEYHRQIKHWLNSLEPSFEKAVAIDLNLTVPTYKYLSCSAQIIDPQKQQENYIQKYNSLKTRRLINLFRLFYKQLQANRKFEARARMYPFRRKLVMLSFECWKQQTSNGIALCSKQLIKNKKHNYFLFFIKQLNINVKDIKIQQIRNRVGINYFINEWKNMCILYENIHVKKIQLMGFYKKHMLKKAMLNYQFIEQNKEKKQIIQKIQIQYIVKKMLGRAKKKQMINKMLINNCAVKKCQLNQKQSMFIKAIHQVKQNINRHKIFHCFLMLKNNLNNKNIKGLIYILNIKKGIKRLQTNLKQAKQISIIQIKKDNKLKKINFSRWKKSLENKFLPASSLQENNLLIKQQVQQKEIIQQQRKVCLNKLVSVLQCQVIATLKEKIVLRNQQIQTDNRFYINCQSQCIQSQINIQSTHTKSHVQKNKMHEIQNTQQLSSFNSHLQQFKQNKQYQSIKQKKQLQYILIQNKIEPKNNKMQISNFFQYRNEQNLIKTNIVSQNKQQKEQQINNQINVQITHWDQQKKQLNNISIFQKEQLQDQNDDWKCQAWYKVRKWKILRQLLNKFVLYRKCKYQQISINKKQQKLLQELLKQHKKIVYKRLKIMPIQKKNKLQKFFKKKTFIKINNWWSVIRKIRFIKQLKNKNSLAINLKMLHKKCVQKKQAFIIESQKIIQNQFFKQNSVFQQFYINQQINKQKQQKQFINFQKQMKGEINVKKQFVDILNQKIKKIFLIKAWSNFKQNVEKFKKQNQLKIYLKNRRQYKLKQKTFQRLKIQQNKILKEQNKNESIIIKQNKEQQFCQKETILKCFTALSMYARQKVLLKKILQQYQSDHYSFYAKSKREQKEFDALKY